MARTIGFILAGLVLMVPRVQAQTTAPSDKEALQLAKSITEHGAATFNRADARAMAAFYTDEAEVAIVGKSASGYKATTYRGRAEIERLYESLFKNASDIHSKNVVEFARFLEPDLLMIYGTFQPNTGQKALPFIQVRVKQGDEWLMSSLQVFALPDQP